MLNYEIIISPSAQVFANEKVISHIEERRFDQHFINIYHKLDVISLVFVVAELLSHSIKLYKIEKNNSSRFSAMLNL